MRSWGRASTLIKDSENIKKRLNVKLKGYDFDRKFVFQEVGYNFEPSEIGAAFGLYPKIQSFFKNQEQYLNLHKKFFLNLIGILSFLK